MLSNLFTLPSDPRRYRAISRKPAEAFRRAAYASPYERVTVRESMPADFGPLARLAGLDSARLPDGPLVVADVDGRLLAAVSIEDGVVIADPFEHTAALVSLVALRAEQLRAVRAERSTAPAAARRRLVPRALGG